MSELERDWADVIKKLMTKAEATHSEAERDAFMVKAQTLMTTYSIDAEMLANRNEEEREKIITADLTYTGIYQNVLWELGNNLARNNTCRTLFARYTYGKKKTVITVIGHESDVARVRLLDTSLNVQAIGEMYKWWKTVDSSWMGGMEKYKERREFIDAFISKIAQRLAEGRLMGERAVANRIAQEKGETNETATTSVGLAVRSRKDSVNDWMDQKYGKLGTARIRGTKSYGSGSARQAGYVAGGRADMGGGKMGGSSRPALGG